MSAHIQTLLFARQKPAQRDLVLWADYPTLLARIALYGLVSAPLSPITRHIGIFVTASAVIDRVMREDSGPIARDAARDDFIL